jgi:hypothetical protein
MRLILFFKAEQFDLFDAPVNVKAGVRGGKTVAAYTRVQKVAAKHPVFGEYSFEKPAHAIVDPQGTVWGWGNPRKEMQNIIDKHADDPEWANHRIEKVTAETAHQYSRASWHKPDKDKAARDAADLEYAKNAPADPDAAAMQRYGDGLRAEEKTIVGHKWEDIQRAQRGGQLHNKVDTSKPLPPVTLSDEDKALVAKHGVEGLAAMGYHGLLDRYHRNEAASAPAKVAVFPKKAPKEHSAMTASEINKRLDKLDAVSSEIGTAMIAAGRGHELPTETHKLSDPLAVRMRENWEQRSALQREVARRYGPGAPSRLPQRTRR